MQCEPIDKNHAIGGKHGYSDGPICDALCDCTAVECKSGLDMDESIIKQLLKCLELLRIICDEKPRAVLCFERMRMPGRYVKEYYKRKLGSVEFHGRDSSLCQDAECF